jgi:hypothetical protein
LKESYDYHTIRMDISKTVRGQFDIHLAQK